MAGFKTDLLKASVLAVATVILLGAATYVLSSRFITPPRPIATVDAYTEKGGYGQGIVSSFYVYNENISIFATVLDDTNNPLANTEVTFEIHGPPNSNITLTQTTTTNSSGVAVATIPAPYTAYQPETALGMWTAVATTEVTGTQIVDSLAFEVKAPPSPFVDVYTDRGGTGQNQLSQPYNRNETVNLYAKVSNGTSPLEYHWVTFAVTGPTNETIPFWTIQPSNASGIATATFRIADRSQSEGIWRVIVTVRIKDKVFIDALTFECNKLGG